VGKKVVNAAKDHGALLLRSKILRLHAFHHTKEKKAIMKLLTLNFLTCAVKACKSSPNSHPLHPKDAELVQDDIDLNPEMIINVLPRLDWQALRTTSSEVCIFFAVKDACIPYHLLLFGLMHPAQLT
jgi:hypothetical protein